MSFAHTLVRHLHGLSAALHRRATVAMVLALDPSLDRDKVESSAKAVFDMLVKDVSTSARWRETEVEILTDRLAKRYDLGMALNEAAQRAILDKQAQPERLSGKQQAALEFQKKYLQGLVDKS